MPRPALLPALLSVCLLSLGAAQSAAAQARRPVVVELFTSQGCAACTTSNTLVADLAERRDVIALTFPVDYWAYLGWKDTFAKPQVSARQRGYQKALGLREVYTPQLVVDGAAQMGKASPEMALEMIKGAAKAHPPAPAMSLARRRLSVGTGRAPKGGAEVWLVRYEGQPQETEVKDGENRGLNVVYRNVARDLVRLGSWTGKDRAYRLPEHSDEDADLKTLILLQSKTNGRILGVLKP